MDEKRHTAPLPGQGVEPEFVLEAEQLEADLADAARLSRAMLWRDVWRRLYYNKLAMAGLGVIALVILVAIFAPLLAPYDPIDTMEYKVPGGINQTPSLKHLLGTDELGRDILSRLIYGSRVAVVVGVVAVLIELVIGLLLGALAGYFGGWGDSVIMRSADIFFAFPTVLGAIAIMTVLGYGLINVFIAIGVLGWAVIARIFRSSILTVKENEYIEAARAMGASHSRIITKHIFPNAIQPIIVYGTMGVGGAILAEAWLAFLGLGLQPPSPSWGNMITDYIKVYNIHTWQMFIPGLVIVATVLAFILLGDGLRDALDPRLKGSI